jgi:hypothetical protein
MRQTWEEIGIDLAESQYTCIGQLDDREITTSLGKRLLMVLSPFVFLQLTPDAPPADPVSTTTLHWTPLASLVSPFTPPKWSSVTVDAASRIAPKHSTALRLIVRLLIGSMQFPAILLDPSPADPKSVKKLEVPEKGNSPSHQPTQNLKLWGLSLGMVLDLMSYMTCPSTGKVDGMNNSPLSPLMQLPYQTDVEDLRVDVVAPSLGSVFPRFSYPDVNFWIWCVGNIFIPSSRLIHFSQGIRKTLSRSRPRLGSKRPRWRLQRQTVSLSPRLRTINCQLIFYLHLA